MRENEIANKIVDFIYYRGPKDGNDAWVDYTNVSEDPQGLFDQIEKAARNDEEGRWFTKQWIAIRKNYPKEDIVNACGDIIEARASRDGLESLKKGFLGGEPGIDWRNDIGPGGL